MAELTVTMAEAASLCDRARRDGYEAGLAEGKKFNEATMLSLLETKLWQRENRGRDQGRREAIEAILNLPICGGCEADALVMLKRKGWETHG